MPDRATAVRRVAPRLGPFVAALLVMAACGDGERTTTTTAPPTTATSVAVSTIADDPAPSTVVTTPAESTGPPSTTDLPTISTSTTMPPVALTGSSLEVASEMMTNPFQLERVGEYGDLIVFDGESDDGDVSVRCVVVGREGESSWSEWCALPGDSATFVVVDGIDPWVVEVGSDYADVSLTQQPADWVVTTSGCEVPLVTLIAAADIAPAVATGIACAGSEAFLTFGSVFMQPGPVDGGGLLLTSGDEGWHTDGRGTSFDCAAFPDGVDRCDRFGVESEMFEAALPIPSPELIAAPQQFVAVREVTDDLRAMTEQVTDLDAITEAIMAGVRSEDAEVEPTVVRHDGISFDRYSLLIIDVPAADDSIRSTTWAAWITTATSGHPSVVHRAYAWLNCARGVADANTCV